MREKERSTIKAVHTENLKGLLGIRRMDGVPKVFIKELCGLAKGLMKVFSVGLTIFKEWRMIAKRMYVGVCVCNR